MNAGRGPGSSISRASVRPRLQEPCRPTLVAIEKFGSAQSPYEDEKVVWRGDRIEWILAHGFQDWLMSELSDGRAIVPLSV